MPRYVRESSRLKLYSGIEDTIGTRKSAVRNVKVNSYADYGDDIQTVARTVLGNDRMELEGTITTIESKAGFNIDLTQKNLQMFLPAIFSADLNESATTAPNFGTATTITSIVTDGFGASGGGLDTLFTSNNLLMAENCPTESNNRLLKATAVTSTKVTVAETLVDDNISSEPVKLTRVGHNYTTGGVSITYASGVCTLIVDTSANNPTFTSLGLERGMQIVLDATGSSNRFVNNRGRARIRQIIEVSGSSKLILDNTSWTPVTETASSLAIRIYFPYNFIRNRVGGGIKDKSMTLLQVLPQTDGDEYDFKIGSAIDECKINIPKPDNNAKVTVDLTYMALYSALYGATDTKPSTTLSAPDEGNCYATANEIVERKFYKRTTSTTNPSAAVSYPENGTINIKNNISIKRAPGSTDGFDYVKGDFQVSGDLNLYYDTISVQKSIKAKEMYGLYYFFGRPLDTTSAEGIFVDLPKIQLASKGKNASKDDAIMFPITYKAVADTDLTTLMCVSYFKYMPYELLKTLGANVP